MRWPNSKRAEKEGILYVEQVVNRHGSIFRKVHQEEDIGIDGFIEFVASNQTEGLLLAVQIKSGKAYERKNRFAITADRQHLEYWNRFMLPVIIIAYSPNRQLACWKAVTDSSSTTIEIPFSQVFDEASMNKGLRSLALTRRDESLLYNAANSIMSDDADQRHQGILLLSQHPTSRVTRLVVQLAGELVLDNDPRIVRAAVGVVGLAIAQSKWASYYGRVDHDVHFFARRTCFRFGERHVRQMLFSIDDGDFGPRSVGEALIDCLVSVPKAEQICRDIVLDASEEARVRLNALVTFYGGEWDRLYADEEVLRRDGLGDILDWLSEQQLSVEPVESTGVGGAPNLYEAPGGQGADGP